MPAQCPECGRFLKGSLVESLVVEPAPCPKCETVLTAAHFPDLLGQPGEVSGATEEPAAAAELRDQAPEAVAEVRDDPAPDPLEGWDVPDAQVVDLDRFRDGRTPPPDAAIVAGAAGFGALVGALTSRRRATGALLGAGIGAAAAAVARRLWVLDA